jgi:PAS domain S-box-containing protein
MHASQSHASVMHARPSFRSSTNHITLILDMRGCILSCGVTAETLLGHSRSALCGRPISQFIAGFALSEASASYRARYLGHLCTDRAWHVFSLIDDHDGHGSKVELSFSRITTVAGRDIIFLKLRPLGEPAGAGTAPVPTLPALVS